MKLKTALKTYVESRKVELRKSTMRSHKHRIKSFIQYLENHCDIKYISELEPKHIDEYARYKQKQIAKSTYKSYIDTLRVFLRYLNRIGYIGDSILNAVPSVSMTRRQAVNSDKLRIKNAQDILETLDRYHYASQKHVYFILNWRVSARISTIRALDVDDFNYNSQYIKVQNRKSTKLKNGNKGERVVSLNDDVSEIINDYIQQNRIKRKEEDRDPLISTKQGRVSKNTLRRWCYQITCPSFYKQKDTDCKCQKNTNQAYACKYTKSPHAVRKSSITYFLKNDVPKKVVSDRADVSKKVLDKHYDKRTEKEKMQQRRSYLDNI